MMEFHSLRIEDIYSMFNSGKDGLKRINYIQNLKKYGKNIIEKKEGVNAWKVFLEQFRGVLIYILFAATIVSAVLGEYLDSIVIIAVLLVNGFVGFVQEYKAEKAIEALKKLVSHKAKVIREGKEHIVDAEDIVPGDIIVIEAGDKVAADARIIEIKNLQTHEAPLTGESMPVSKDACALKECTALPERKNMVYSGTIVTRGHAKAIATATGMSSEIGNIAKMIQSSERKLTPLQKYLAAFGKRLGIAVIIICAIVFVVGLLRWGNPIEMLITAVALAVAAVPEGLPIVVTISLALGTKRMLKRNAMIRRLASVETLGSTSVICSDKTGTLTKNEMTVKRIFANDKIVDVSGTGYKAIGKFLHEGKKVDLNEIGLLLKIGALNNNSTLDREVVIGDPTEGCLLVSAKKAGIDIDALSRKYPRIDEIEFTSERKMMSTVHKAGKKTVAFTKGAPDNVIMLCNRILVNGIVKKLDEAKKKKLLEINKTFAADALRVLAFAYKETGYKFEEKNLIFVGLQAMMDPPREEVKEAVNRCMEAGIKVVMITGDNENTAKAIAKQLGIEGRSVNSSDIDKINLERECTEITIYSRVEPKHKIKIIAALKKRGYVVAMTGDGVNDAPALKSADIGVAMGKTGTEVAKDASDIVLMDDNFATIVNAVEEGRGIFDNIKKFVIYLLSSNLGEILTLFIGILIGLPLPVIALQILWINIATDSFPALALGVEKPELGIMKRKPRKLSERIIDFRAGSYMVFISVVMAAGTLGLFYRHLAMNGWTFGAELARDSPVYLYGTSIAFTALVMFQLFNVLNCRTLNESVFRNGIFSNRWLIAAIFFSIGLQLMVLYTPLSKLFHTMPLALADLLLIALVSSSVLWLSELIKLAFAKKDVM